jgi:hypothetical protein
MDVPVPQVDYRANPSFAGDVAQGVDSYENPNAAPAVFVPLPGLPDPDSYIDNDHPTPGYVQEGLGLDVERSVQEQWADYNRDAGGKGYTSW